MLHVEALLRSQYGSFYQNYPKIMSKAVTKLFKLILHEKEINDFLEHNTLQGIAFVEAVLDTYEVSYSYKSKEVENIPAQGRVVVIANHPLGGMDSLVLLKLISDKRADKKVKIVANKMLMHFDPIRELLIPVNNVDGTISKCSRKAMLDALDKEEAVIFFPSAAVSRAGVFGIKDEKFKTGFIKLARLAHAPILPLHLKAKNSWKFYVLSALYKPLGALLLSHEMLKPKHKSIDICIGALIPTEAFSNTTIDLKVYAKLFKKHLYRIGKDKKGIFLTQKCIAHPEQKQILKSELKASKHLGETHDGKIIYLVEYKASPTVMAEIGRLRELSFRHVGEGTGQKRDIDRFDSYYRHLVLWDDEALELVGAYRMGIAQSIIEHHGTKGLYMSEICEIRKPFLERANQAVELGRSFVQPKYWGSRALDYLWQGIGAFLQAYSDVHYLYGAVSISGHYPKAAQDALVYFFSTYFKPKERFFKSFERYRYTAMEEEELDLIFKGNEYKEDLMRLKAYLKNFDVAIPTLFKQYSDLCEEGGVSFSDFGIDENFGGCVDGYLMVDIDKMKPKKYERYIKMKS